MKYIFPILLLVFCGNVIGENTHTSQDGITVDVSLEPTSFTVGDSLTLRIEANAADGVQLTLPQDKAFGPFIVTDVSTLLDIPSKQGRQWIWSMQLDTFDASVSAFKDIAIEWTDSAGQTGTISIDPIPVYASSAAGDMANKMELRDIKSAVPLLTTLSWWPFLIGAGFILVVITLAIFFFYPRQRIAISPYEKAMQALQSLHGSNQDVQGFYTSLSKIVRTYIEDRFQISAHGKTTREFLIAEKEDPRFEHSDRQALANFLVAADLVKFARHEPKTNTWDDAIKRAEQFVLNTIPSAETKHAEVAA